MTRSFRNTALADHSAHHVASLPSLEAETAEDQDGVLLAICREFDELYLEWHPKWLRMREMEATCADHVDAMGGFTMDRYRQAGERTGYFADIDVNNGHFDLLEALAKKIRATKAKTIEGLAAKASVLIFDAVPLHQFLCEEGERDWDREQVLAFAEELREFAKAA